MTGRHELSAPLTFEALAAPAVVRKVTVQDIDGSGVDVAYIDVGQGPVVVLIHGLGEHLGYWSENVDGLVRQGLRVVALDLPGSGRSGKPDLDYSMIQQATWLNALLEIVVPEAPVHLVGHSMGGQVALRAALLYRRRISSLTLVAPAGIERFTEAEVRFLKQGTSARALGEKDEDQLRAYHTRALYVRFGEVAEHHLGERVRLRGSPDFAAYLRAVVRGIHAMLDGPVADELGALRDLPTTVVFGEQDALIPNPFLHPGPTADVADEARRLLPRAHVVLLPDVGHMAQIEASAAVDLLIVENVKRASAPMALESSR